MGLIMSLTVTFPAQVIFLTIFIFTFVANSFADPVLEKKEVQLEDFLKGVSLSEQSRLAVRDILAGNMSVKNLFREIEPTQPSLWDYYFFRKKEFNFVLASPDNLQILREKLRSNPINELTVILEDDQAGFWRRLGMDADSRYQRNLEFSVKFTPTPCEDVTRLIYEEINSIFKTRIQSEKQTETKIDINEVFDSLVNNKLIPYLESLESSKSANPCFNDFKLLNWLRGDKAAGFEYGEYLMKPELKALLEPALNAIKQTISNSDKRKVTVKIIGYTDDVPVKTDGIDVVLSATGVDGWDKINNPLNIQYSACRNDFLNGKEPFYIDLINNKTTKLEKVHNNCELGAVRAYVAAVYLTNELGTDGFEYSYATGGIAPSDKPGKTDIKNDPGKRRINIEFVIKTAKEN